jgi:hypothetical protein
MSEPAPGYQLALPSPGQVCVSVLRVCREAGRETWEALCQRAEVAPLAAAYSLDELERLAAVLRAEPGVLRVVGQSLAVRLSTYRALSSLASEREAA